MFLVMLVGGRRPKENRLFFHFAFFRLFLSKRSFPGGQGLFFTGPEKSQHTWVVLFTLELLPGEGLPSAVPAMRSFFPLSFLAFPNCVAGRNFLAQLCEPDQPIFRLARPADWVVSRQAVHSLAFRP